MRVHIVLASAVVAAALAGASTAAATTVVDQEQPSIDATVGGLSVGGFFDQRIAQVVTPGITGDLVAVALPVACAATTELVVEIHGVTASTPDDRVLARFTVPGTALPSFFPSPPQLRRLDLPTPVEQRAGVPFAIVVDSPGDCGMFRGPVGDTYAGGDAYFDSRPNPVGVWVCICAFAGERRDVPFRTFVAADTAPPTLVLPADTTVDATSPAGAEVAFAASAEDAVDPSPTVSCLPASGSTFPIGDTTVTCTASDASGNTSTGTFVVTVRGAAEQLASLRQLALRIPNAGVAESLATKLAGALRAAERACPLLAAFVHETQALAGRQVPLALAEPLLAGGTRVRAVLDC